MPEPTDAQIDYEVVRENDALTKAVHLVEGEC